MKKEIEKEKPTDKEIKKSKKEIITPETLKNFYRKFKESHDDCDKISMSEFLFDSDNKGLFNLNNYSSGIDIPLRKYFVDIYNAPRINGQFAFIIYDVIRAVVNVSKFRDTYIAILLIDNYNKNRRDYDSKIYNLEWNENGRQILHFRVNGYTGSINDYCDILNFIGLNGAFPSVFGKTSIGYNFKFDDKSAEKADYKNL